MDTSAFVDVNVRLARVCATSVLRFRGGTMERTLSIIKPDAVGKGLIGEVVRRFEKAG